MDHPEQQPPRSELKNTDLSFPSLAVGEFLSQYGWFLLAVSSLLYLLIHLLMQHLRRRPSPPGPLPDVELVSRRQEGMEAARKRMQEDLDAKAAVFQEKRRQQEEEKRRQKIESWESMRQGKSCRDPPKPLQEEEASSSAAKPKPDKKPLRSTDYSPLSGQGGGASCTWRPGRKGPSSGG
ncbi:selenoprotein S [Cololabis saira]|uniref:selenoprotein S n=1 Tax=Cololabis saira TaxID=129043 RepID=UPI002AD36EC3|nr:selenoprotein S [Cololabis saira]